LDFDIGDSFVISSTNSFFTVFFSVTLSSAFFLVVFLTVTFLAAGFLATFFSEVFFVVDFFEEVVFLVDFFGDFSTFFLLSFFCRHNLIICILI
jgi:hypothetical protein